jgi:hypothetical protein
MVRVRDAVGNLSILWSMMHLAGSEFFGYNSF